MTPLSQLNKLKKIIENSENPKLAAENWNENWKTLVAIILSAQTRDTKTIPVCEKLFEKFPSPKKLGNAPLSKIKEQIKSLNYYKTKSKHIKETCQIISKNKIPEKFEDLIKLPGVGRKTANVYLSEAKKIPTIAVDTHVARISQKLNWTKNSHPHKIEKDLKKLFPKKYWRSINYILVTFGQTIGKSKKHEDEILKNIIQKHL